MHAPATNTQYGYSEPKRNTVSATESRKGLRPPEEGQALSNLANHLTGKPPAAAAQQPPAGAPPSDGVDMISDPGEPGSSSKDTIETSERSTSESTSTQNQYDKLHMIRGS